MKHFFASLLFLFSCITLQAQTIIIGAGATSGTASNGATGDCGPMYRSSATSNFVYSMHHYLYTQAELTAAGLPVGATITSLAWNKDNAAASNANFLFQIWMKNSGLTAVQTPPQNLSTLITGSTSVYNSASSVLPATIGFIDYPFTTSFVYTGGAIEVTVNFNMSSGTSPWTTLGVSWKRDAITNRTISYCNSTAGTALNNLRTVRPQLRITYTSGPPCASPTGLAASGITLNGANLSWAAVSGSTGYEYVVDQVAGNPSGAGTAIAGTSFTASGLTSATTYYLHVRNKCSATNFSQWATVPFTTTTCPAAGGLAATAITQTSATLNWTAVSGSAGYEYVLDQVAGNPSGAGTATTSTTFNASGLTSSTTYYLHVRNKCNATTFSAWPTISFVTAACPTPGSPAASAITQTSATLSWTAASGTGYEYVLDQVAANPSGAGTPTTATSFNASGLTSATTYYLHVRNKCAATSISSWVTISFTTLACPAPLNLTASSVTQTSATLSWTAATGSNYEYVLDQTPANPAGAGTATTALSYNAIGLTSNTTYYMHVRNKCAATSLSTWVTTSFTTLPCPQPGNVAAANITATTAMLSWTPAPGYTDYAYVVDQSAADPVVPGTATTNTVIQSTGLSQNTTYYFHVRTNCGTTSLSSWVTIPFTTGECNSPINILVGNITDTSADLLWSQVPNVSYYEFKVDPASSVFNSNGAIMINKFNAHVASLAPVTEYFVYVRARCYVNDSSGWIVDSFETLPACSAPLVKINSPAPDQYDASWDPIQGALGYEYAVTNSPTGPALGKMMLDQVLNLTLLPDGKNYYLHVRTICSSMPVFSGWHSNVLRVISQDINQVNGKQQITLYPNPVTDKLGVTGATGDYTIYDISSRPVRKGVLTSKANIVSTADLAPGIYLMKIGREVMRFVKN